MKIEVTCDDIAAALKAPAYEKMAECCPIAQALRRMFPGQSIYVGMHGMKVGGAWYYPTPPKHPVFEVVSLTRYFWGAVTPFSFEAEALFTMKVEVTRDDIDNAVLADCIQPGDSSNHCPVAQAFKRLFPNAVTLRAGLVKVYVDDSRYRICSYSAEAMLGFTSIPPERWSVRCKPAVLEFNEYHS